MLPAALYAFTCPSVADIQQGHFQDWLPLTQAYEELASDQDVAAFKLHVKTFTLAAWDKHYLENAHCFYQGDDPIVEKIVFARDAWRPTPNAFWVWITERVRAECYSQADCDFTR